MPLTIVNVAYPLAPVGPDAVGGAEQVLQQIDRHLVEHGDRSIVIACAGSQVAGELVEIPVPSGTLTAGACAAASSTVGRALDRVLSRKPVDVVHFHGHDFDAYLPSADVAALATIHLPPELLTARLAAITRRSTWVHGVSAAQQRRLPPVPFLLPPIENGVPVEALPRRVRRRRFALAIGRICPEKGFHLAADAARLARMPLVLAGRVFAYPEHRAYYEREIRPRLGATCRFVGPASFAAKRRLLSAAACLLVTSQVPETSSLVAMEALACGTPVVALASDALREIVDHGVTGFLVGSVPEMADAIARAGEIAPEACHAHALQRFSVRRMLQDYLERYRQVLAWSRSSPEQPSTLIA